MADTDIYVRPFLKLSQRKKWENFVRNQTIFIPEYIYQPNDEDFGVQTDIRMYLEYGIQQLNLGDYTPALERNFYQKKLSFGKIKTAIAKDQTGQHTHDVVYVEVVDNLDGVKQSVTMNNITYYPASIENMRKSLRNLTVSGNPIIIDNTKLPDFMKTIQPGTYRPLGYIKAVVLCYTTPGDGSKIVGRIRTSKFNFNELSFEFNRIIVENSLDNSTDKYLLFPELSITDNH
jgi:hypothetical protein